MVTISIPQMKYSLLYYYAVWCSISRCLPHAAASPNIFRDSVANIAATSAAPPNTDSLPLTATGSAFPYTYCNTLECEKSQGSKVTYSKSGGPEELALPGTTDATDLPANPLPDLEKPGTRQVAHSTQMQATAIKRDAVESAQSRSTPSVYEFTPKRIVRSEAPTPPIRKSDPPAEGVTQNLGEAGGNGVQNIGSSVVGTPAASIADTSMDAAQNGTMGNSASSSARPCWGARALQQVPLALLCVMLVAFAAYLGSKMVHCIPSAGSRRRWDGERGTRECGLLDEAIHLDLAKVHVTIEEKHRYSHGMLPSPPKLAHFGGCQ
ncbi:hypothetical protein BC834DRAFT_875962 [Gloeopeniophorella convolvens]|nr:hypothetical protein BC834DRAFT_875962 [Gloeopeniophorella convolvens]